MCELDLDIEVDGTTSDGISRRVAFRDVRRSGSIFSVNGERIFLKGASYAPTRALMGEDYWPYGFELNRETLSTFLRYHHECGLSPRLLDAQELFAPEAMESFKI